ncbi:MAG TPA: hypothetical protein VGS58_10790 [Candidatus Sulfopaludibacter sp.]|nr:hypothetical protein [Candidatus Sulfopaludibacter sp.]
MAQGLPGADSSLPVTTELIQAAAGLFGANPCFWGRYFTSVTTTGSVEYRHAQENGPLSAAGLRLLPIARQTNHVAGGQGQGLADGVANAQDFVTTFGVPLLAAQGGQFYIFLDVEHAPSLSQEYYTGWAQGLEQESQALSGGSVQVLPCVYGPWSGTATWTALAAAMAAGVPCQGAWMARYPSSNCAMREWSDQLVTPAAPSPFPCPILAWQYAENCLGGQIDTSQTNPNIDANSQLLPFLVLPPGQPLAT